MHITYSPTDAYNFWLKPGADLGSQVFGLPSVPWVGVLVGERGRWPSAAFCSCTPKGERDILMNYDFS